MNARDDEMLNDRVNSVVASITAEVAAREALKQAPETIGDTPADDRDQLHHERSVLELEPLATDDDDAWWNDGLDDLPGMFDDALEVRREGYSTGDGWVVERVRACVGLGGPNLYVYTDGDSAWVDGYWGGSKCEGVYFDRATADAIAGALDYWLNEADHV